MSVEPTHEYIFLLTKQPRYWFDTEAVREPSSPSTVRIHSSEGVKERAGEWKSEHVGNGHSGLGNGPNARDVAAGRNVRSVWTTDEPQLHVAPLHNDRKEHMENGLYLDDGDVRLYLGDALETVRGMPDESVDCVVTSPPYWGLRDYGTGSWEGGDTNCDHIAVPHSSMRPERSRATSDTFHGSMTTNHSGSAGTPFRDVCGKCGATRTDRQMGLEATPDLFVAGMVELFREIRRVLAPHGTCWVNLGDSYSGGGGYAPDAPVNVARREQGTGTDGKFRFSPRVHDRQAVKPKVETGLKPKDLVGIPWRVAFALQADGWWLRSDIIWAKPNPMPESVSDRPTKAHEYVFLLTKAPRYWFDTEAVREKAESNGYENADLQSNEPGWSGNPNVHGEKGHALPGAWTNGGGRNVRSVWNIATQPYPEAHFATFPQELARRCILAGCPTRVCRVCGKPSERIVERTGAGDGSKYGERAVAATGGAINGGTARSTLANNEATPVTVGWSDCGHNDWRPGVTLDPFIGSGTVAKVARDHQRHAIGIDLNETYLELASRRLQQLSLLT